MFTTLILKDDFFFVFVVSIGFFIFTNIAEKMLKVEGFLMTKGTHMLI